MGWSSALHPNFSPRLEAQCCSAQKAAASPSDTACALAQGRPPARRTELLVGALGGCAMHVPSSVRMQDGKEGSGMIPPGESLTAATALFSSSPHLFNLAFRNHVM